MLVLYTVTAEDTLFICVVGHEVVERSQRYWVERTAQQAKTSPNGTLSTSGGLGIVQPRATVHNLELLWSRGCSAYKQTFFIFVYFPTPRRVPHLAAGPRENNANKPSRDAGKPVGLSCCTLFAMEPHGGPNIPSYCNVKHMFCRAVYVRSRRTYYRDGLFSSHPWEHRPTADAVFVDHWYVFIQHSLSLSLCPRLPRAARNNSSSSIRVCGVSSNILIVIDLER